MTKKEYLNLCIKYIQEYYKETGLTIININDHSTLATKITKPEKSLLKSLSKLLKNKNLSLTTIEILTKLINKTEHINYILENNLSLEELNLLKRYSQISTSPKFIRKILEPTIIPNLINNNKEKIFLSEIIKESQEPIVIYKSGISNLMRKIGINKNTKKQLLQNSINKSPKDIISEVISSIETNIKNILSLNNTADIYIIGTYIPNNFQNLNNNLIELINKYNYALIELCKKYNITYINVSTPQNNNLEKTIIEYIYIRKQEPNRKNLTINNNLNISNFGPKGVGNEILKDYQQTTSLITKLINTHEIEIQKEIAKKQLKEIEIFQKVLKRTKTIR